MGNLIILQDPSLSGPQSHTVMLVCKVLKKQPLISRVAALWRHLNNQSAILPDGNTDCRMAWLETIIHLEWSNEPEDWTPSRQLQKKTFSKLQNKNADDQPVPPCCPPNCNGLCNYENQTPHPEAEC